jgi:hypothetical protein
MVNLARATSPEIMSNIQVGGLWLSCDGLIRQSDRYNEVSCRISCSTPLLPSSPYLRQSIPCGRSKPSNACLHKHYNTRNGAVKMMFQLHIPTYYYNMFLTICQCPGTKKMKIVQKSIALHLDIAHNVWYIVVDEREAA